MLPLPWFTNDNAARRDDMHPTTTTRQLGTDHGSGEVIDATGLPRPGANAAAVAAERGNRLVKRAPPWRASPGAQRFFSPRSGLVSSLSPNQSRSVPLFVSDNPAYASQPATLNLYRPGPPADQPRTQPRSHSYTSQQLHTGIGTQPTCHFHTSSALSHALTSSRAPVCSRRLVIDSVLIGYSCFFVDFMSHLLRRPRCA